NRAGLYASGDLYRHLQSRRGSVCPAGVDIYAPLGIPVELPLPGRHYVRGVYRLLFPLGRHLLDSLVLLETFDPKCECLQNHHPFYPVEYRRICTAGDDMGFDVPDVTAQPASHALLAKAGVQSGRRCLQQHGYLLERLFSFPWHRLLPEIPRTREDSSPIGSPTRERQDGSIADAIESSFSLQHNEQHFKLDALRYRSRRYHAGATKQPVAYHTGARRRSTHSAARRNRIHRGLSRDAEPAICRAN